MQSDFGQEAQWQVQCLDVQHGRTIEDGIFAVKDKAFPVDNWIERKIADCRIEKW